MQSEVSHAFTFLTRMELQSCEGLVSFAESNFPPALKQLKISSCDNLQYLFDESMSRNTFLLEHLEIAECNSLTWLSSRGDICNRLQHLQILRCPKLSSLFLNAKLPVMLKKLDICGCRVLECIAQDFHESTDLEIIKVFGVQNIKSLLRGLDKHSHLQEINLSSCSNLVISSKVHQQLYLPSELKVCNCRADISFPEEGFPTNLTSLEISGAPRIYNSLVKWGIHRLTSLQYLDINGEDCSNVVSFPEESIGMALPHSLTFIWISNFNNRGT
ncbi:hypothetical protein V6N13_085480 [Hibiscus sabdariffa]|uniref:Uncharacterized protein n=1 Tax=Hibiscus sabdariffa TaxID=183260 RepID=A0ABR2D1S1_9ROSI